MKRRTAISDRNQDDRIWELLLSRGEEWTAALELSKTSLQYCRAINSLRRRGVLIENKLVSEGGIKHGFYRLQQTLPLIRKRASTTEQPGLFTSSELESSRGWKDPEEEMR